MALTKRVVACVVCVCTWAACARGDDVVVNTRYGALRGSRVAVGPQSHVDVFHNIPYAKPPLGGLRFQKPVAHGAWAGTRDARRAGPMCAQGPYHWVDNQTVADGMVGQEDCLVLNVYAPSATPAAGGPLPVMLWVHGGGYLIGSANQYDGRWLAAKGVVVVTINYRLGALGFLSTEDGVSVGNYGLWDQIQALKWVKAAISAFNGDPNDVTIFGQSAGSSSVSLLTLSREAAGLFTKAIMQSGTSLSPWAAGHVQGDPYPRGLGLALGAQLGCDVTGSEMLLDCLRAAKPADIIRYSGSLQSGDYLAFAPVFEWTFGRLGLFAGTPEVVLENGWFNNVTVIRGFVRDEFMAQAGISDPNENGLTMDEFLNGTRELARQAHSRYPLVPEQQVVDLVVDTYVTRPGLSTPTQLRHALGLAYTDFDFISPTFKEQRLWKTANGNTEFCYCITYRSAHRKGPQWWGVIHADEILYVFGETNNPTGNWHEYQIDGGYTEDDKQFSEMIMTMWTDFAKYGTPTPAGSRYPQWTPSTAAATEFLDVKLDPEMEEVPAARAPSIRLWSDVIPQLHQAAQAALVG